ncbi:MAG TPA: hypothetical protein VGS23_09900 [Thermoplasmata archaeon]|nr:hypothetical protein [Thermoplasmata archaeon]
MLYALVVYTAFSYEFWVAMGAMLGCLGATGVLLISGRLTTPSYLAPPGGVDDSLDGGASIRLPIIESRLERIVAIYARDHARPRPLNPGEALAQLEAGE